MSYVRHLGRAYVKGYDTADEMIAVYIRLLDEEEALQIEQGVKIANIRGSSQQLLSSIVVGVGLQQNEREASETHVRVPKGGGTLCAGSAAALLVFGPVMPKGELALLVLRVCENWHY
jgi:hypothetical protein